MKRLSAVLFFLTVPLLLAVLIVTSMCIALKALVLRAVDVVLGR